MKTFFKYFTFPILFCLGGSSFGCYMVWKDYHNQEILIDKALQGNRYAIAILRTYEKPWKLDSKVIDEALQGNVYALEVLNIDPKPTGS